MVRRSDGDDYRAELSCCNNHGKRGIHFRSAEGGLVIAMTPKDIVRPSTMTPRSWAAEVFPPEGDS